MTPTTSEGHSTDEFPIVKVLLGTVDAEPTGHPDMKLFHTFLEVGFQGATNPPKENYTVQAFLLF